MDDNKFIISHLSSSSWKISRMGVERIRALLEMLGNPHQKLRCIHIAGTNGKGSVAAMLSSILQEAGYNTGLFISPYVHQFNERIQRNGQPISQEELASISGEIRLAASRMREHPTQFEQVTAAAFAYFHRKQCDIVVLEVGMGGRLDATNVIGKPEVAVITSISLDHTVELGDTIEKIAGEKAGIIKDGCDVVTYVHPEPVARVIRQRCDQTRSSLHMADFDRIEMLGHDHREQSFHFGRHRGLTIPLLGDYQLNNAALALTAVEVLQKKGWNISDKAVRDGLMNTVWPGRFEVIHTSPTFIVDTGHNAQCAQAVVRNLSAYFPGRKVTFLIGVLADKNYKAIFDAFCPHAVQFVLVTPPSLRALRADKLQEFTQKYPVSSVACQTVEDGIRKVLELTDSDGVICAFGSIYTVHLIRDFFSDVR